MSGDLKHPSKAIPKGTLYGLATTFVLYTLVIFAMATTITRGSFLRNANVIQDTNISGLVVLAGELASSLFSTLMGVIGSAKLLQALARDNLLPGFWIFAQGTKKGDEPTYAIFATYLVAQVTMLCDLNQIASFVTMTYLVSLELFSSRILLTKIDDIPRDESSVFPPQNRLGAKLPTLISLFQLADCFYWDHCLRSGYVLCGRILCVWMCWDLDRPVSYYPLYIPSQELGRCFAIAHLSSSPQIFASFETGAC